MNKAEFKDFMNKDDEEVEQRPAMSQSANISFPTSHKPSPEEIKDAKYKVGQVVWFYGWAGSTDDIYGYPCIGRGRITDIYPLDWPNASYYSIKGEISYRIEGEFCIGEANIYPDKPDKAIEKLEKNWESEWYCYLRKHNV